MLISCPECSKQISDKVTVCPHCGYPFEEDENEETIDDIIQQQIPESGGFLTRNSETIKITIGVISIVLSTIVWIQSCTIGALNRLTENQDIGSSIGLWISIVFLVCGIINIVNRKNKQSGVGVSIAYIIAAVAGFFYSTNFKDLQIWALISLIFGAAILMCRSQKR